MKLEGKTILITGFANVSKLLSRIAPSFIQQDERRSLSRAPFVDTLLTLRVTTMSDAQV